MGKEGGEEENRKDRVLLYYQMIVCKMSEHPLAPDYVVHPTGELEVLQKSDSC